MLLERYHILPSQFADMTRGEKAVVIASLEMALDTEKKQSDKMKRKK